MGGGDKGLAGLGGTTMLAHVIDRFRPQVSRLILNANGAPERFTAFGLEVVADRAAADQGPLAGVLTAIEWAERLGQGYPAVATVTTDVPFLPADLVARLSAAAVSGGGCCSLAIASSADRFHACIGLWPLGLKDHVRQALLDERRSVEAFAKANGAIAVSFPFSDIGGRVVDPFFNANTPDDMRAARALLTGQP